MNEYFLQIADLIKKFREEKQLSQTEFGEKLGGYEQGSISDIERGRQTPSLEFYRRLRTAFGSSADHIIYKSVSRQWDEIEKILLDEGVSEDILGRVQGHILAALALSGEHRYAKKEKDWALVAESQNAEYQTEKIRSERRRPENSSKREFVDKVLRILDSGKGKLVTALEYNVEAFLSAIEPDHPKTEEGD